MRYFIGLISGTSVDGIDTVIADFSEPQPEIIATHLHPIPTDTRAALVKLFQPGADSLDDYGRLDRIVGNLCADAVTAILSAADLSAEDIVAIGSHGQTVRHRPRDHHPFTLQIGNPHVIATQTGIDVIADFRSRDMAMAGQGAPLAPTFHRAFFKRAEQNCAVVNLGGIANITWLPRDPDQPPLAFDSGPANGLLDAWYHRHHHGHFDRNGAWAKSGDAIPELVARWLQDPFFALPPPKSTGKEDFHLDWIEAVTPGALTTQQPQDIQASLLALTVESIASSMRRFGGDPDCVLLCGGGSANDWLVHELRNTLGCPVSTTEAAGIHPDWVEAMTFAWLAYQHHDQRVVEFSPFTGANGDGIPGVMYRA